MDNIGYKTPLNSMLAVSIAVLGGLVAPIEASVAETIVVPAFDAATIRPDGPRSGDAGKAFFNVEGIDNGQFANYGVLRFNLTAIDPTITDLSAATINSVSLSLTQANAFFTQTGNVAVWFSDDDGASIQPGAAARYSANFSFHPSAPFVTAGGHPFDVDFPNSTIVGGQEFFEVSSGTTDVIALDRNLQVFADSDSGDLIITLIFAEFNDAKLAATWEGAASTNPPRLTINYTP